MPTRAATTCFAFALVVLAAACGDGYGDDKATQPTAPGGAFAGTQAATSPAAGGTAASSVDGTYVYDLANLGVTAQLLFAVQGGQLAIAQLSLSNESGAAIKTAPEIRVIDEATGQTAIATTAPDWNRLYPAGGAGFQSGRRGQVRVYFTQAFNPEKVRFCMTAGGVDLGCFSRTDR